MAQDKKPSLKHLKGTVALMAKSVPTLIAQLSPSAMAEAMAEAQFEYDKARNAFLSTADRIQDWTPVRAMIAHELGLDLDSKESKGIDALKSSLERLIHRAEAASTLATKLLKLESVTSLEELQRMKDRDRRGLLKTLECRPEVVESLRLTALAHKAEEWLTFVCHHIEIRDRALRDRALSKATATTAKAKGSITQTPKADSYPEGAIVTLTAKASENSKFVRTEGDASGLSEEKALSQRIETLEHNLMLALEQIEQLQRQLSQAAAPNLPTPPREVPPTTASDPLLDILKWLATQERVALSEFRRRLLPLDLLTGAVIEDVNERALDVKGEIALEEDGDDIVVMQDVLAAVLVAWTPGQH